MRGMNELHEVNLLTLAFDIIKRLLSAGGFYSCFEKGKFKIPHKIKFR